MTSTRRVLRAEKIHHVRLFAQVDSDELSPRNSGNLLDKRSLSHAWWSLDEDGLPKRVRSQELHQVSLSRSCMEGELWSLQVRCL